MLNINNLLFTFLITSCGIYEKSKNQNEQSESIQSLPESNIIENETIAFKGYVLNGFEITVDGNKFQDMEDFYTQELDKLPSKVAAVGYDKSYKISFNADVGFNDLWKDMQVYLAAVSKRGYQGESKVESAGKFTINLPTKAGEENYRVRANKRLSLTLNNGQETIKICYNFSAIDKSVKLTDHEKPIILDTFVTRITKYDCEQDENNGIKIPEKTKVSTNIIITKGINKADLLQMVGQSNLTIESTNKWCWYSTIDNPAQLCAVGSPTACQCYITFDDDGKVLEQFNIKAEHLKTEEW